jgi:hypothetical protein
MLKIGVWKEPFEKYTNTFSMPGHSIKKRKMFMLVKWSSLSDVTKMFTG